MKKIIPLTIPSAGDQEIKAAAEVIRSGWLTQGPKTAEFEKIVAEYVGAEYGIAASSGTSALVLALLAAGIQPGDEVVTTPYSFIATANAIIAVGAVPVFADIDLETYNLDPGKAAHKISPRTRALLPVDQMGLPCDLKAFQVLADEYGLSLIQDAACALGSLYQGNPVGGGLKVKQSACFSFHPRKVITTGEGGMLVCNDEELANNARALASHGAIFPELTETQKQITTPFTAPDYPLFGHNFRMSDILAAIGLAQMGRLPKILKRRQELAERYNIFFANHKRIVIPIIPDWAQTNYQTYQIRIDGADRSKRNQLVNNLRNRRIMATYGVADIHRQVSYRHRFGVQQLPMAELAADSTLILPLYPQMTNQEQERCTEELLAFVD